MPIDPLYADSTNQYLTGQNQANVPQPPTPSPSTSLVSLAKDVGRGLGQGGATLAGGAADLTAGLSQLFVDPDTAIGTSMNPQAQADQDKRINDALTAGGSGHLFQSGAGAANYDLADTLKPDPSRTTAVDQTVQGAVSGLTQFILPTLIGGPIAGIAVGSASTGLGAAEDLKRQGVDVGTRTEIGALNTGIGLVGAAVPVVGQTFARTAALALAAGPGVSILQGLAEKAILRNSNYDHLADQINPLDPVNLAASLAVPAFFGGLHTLAAARAGAAADAGTPTPTATAPAGVDLTSLPVDQRKTLPYNSPALDAYATQQAEAAGVPPSMVLFIKNVGERSNSNQVSPTGARGVMQFEPATWNQYGHGDPTDPVNSIDAAVAYSKDLLKRYDGDQRAAITEYNGGIEQARDVQAGGAPTAPETVAYLNRYDQFAANHEITNATFNPTPAQTDAALTSTGQQIVDDAHAGAPDDPNSMAIHQQAFQDSAQRMDNMQMPDVGNLMQPELVRAESLRPFANDIAAAVAEPESVQQAAPAQSEQIPTARGFEGTQEPLSADLKAADGTPFTMRRQFVGNYKMLTPDGQKIGAVSYIHSPLDEWRVTGVHVEPEFRRRGVASAAYDYIEREITKEPFALTGSQSADGAAFRAGRAAKQEEAARTTAARTPESIDEAVNAPLGDAGLDDVNAKLSDAGITDAAAKPQSPVEQNVRAAAAEQPDLMAHLDSNDGEITGRLGDLVQRIDDEHQATLDDTKLLSVAANCFITGL